MKTSKSPGGIIVPNQATPDGYIKLTDLHTKQSILIAAGFIVVVETINKETLIHTTINERALTVSETFDEVLDAIAEAQ